ncbi:hypothetical protein DPMN_039728 [Dreissena polymorpha]|uniref:Uncharacterized protein n=1 Tax=Dreissena polymorpha TaxID=45954 RepID=A0A9D4CVH5_DREPO|nr:hypothetical protein DPMN_039728 [Dreissena polymorpha]
MAEGGMGRTDFEPESNIRHSSLYARYSQNYIESVSLEISVIMTRLVYGEKNRRWRAEKFKEFDLLRNAALGRYMTGITVGSKAEGLTCWLESAKDWLMVVNGILCVEAGININYILNDIEVYRMDPSVYPGHCRLFLEKPVTARSNIIHKYLCEDGDANVLLSSSVLLDECLAF